MNEKTRTLEQTILDGMYLDAFDLGDDEIEAAVHVLASKRLGSSFGKKVKEFEGAFADYLGIRHAVATSSGTTALHLGLAALGVGPGDEVIIPACSSVATANAVLYQNAIPVFADVDPDTFTIDPSDVEQKITLRTKGVIVVHMYGCPGDIDSIRSIVRERDLFLVEDCALATGAEYHGQKVGTLGDLGCFSFGVGKQLNLGQGGMVVTDDSNTALAIEERNHHYSMPRMGRLVGQAEIMGFNFKLTEIHAAIGLVQLAKLDHLNKRRIANAAALTQYLEGEKRLRLPRVPDGVKHVFNVYPVILCEEAICINRDAFMDALRAEGVPCDPLFDTPINLEPTFQKRIGYGSGCPFECPLYLAQGGVACYSEGLCPTAEAILKQVITLPVHPGLNENTMHAMALSIRRLACSVAEPRR